MKFQAATELFKKLMASQLRKPSGGPIGWIMLDRLNHWNREMNRKSLATMELQGAEQVLELGCGGGDLLGLMAQKMTSGKVTGQDWSPLAIRFCKHRFKRYIDQGKLDLVCRDAVQIPLPDSSIDCICTVNTVYFWDEPEAVLAECARVLKRGGRIVLCNSDLSGLSTEDYPPEYFTSHAVEEVSHRLHSLGFSKPVVEYGEDDHAEFYTLNATLET
jgi:ubiquinone/menaquinone biosynthesis C-methylase UbiE